MMIPHEAARNRRCHKAIGLTEYPESCLGDECMAWRWAGTGPGVLETGDGQDALGYCGLAGKPNTAYPYLGDWPHDGSFGEGEGEDDATEEGS